MRKIFLHMMTSLDGYIEDRHKGLDWHRADDEFETYVLEVLKSIDGMIYGRVAHELLASYWPDAGNQPDISKAHVEMAEIMNRLPKYAITHGPYQTNWENSHVISGDAEKEIRQLKQQDGGDIALFGGASVARSLIRMGLVDEYHFVVNPVLLGGGTPLFLNGIARKDLELIHTQSLSSGIVIHSYKAQDELSNTGL